MRPLTSLETPLATPLRGRRTTLMAGLSLFALLLLGACGSNSPAPTPTPNGAVIAKVGDSEITQAQFDLRLNSTLASLQQGGAPTPSSSSDPMLETLKSKILGSLIDDTIVAREAASKNVAVTDSDIQSEIDKDSSAAGGIDALLSQLTKSGRTLDSLKDEIRARLNEQHLEDAFAKERVQQVLAALKGGQDFGTVAGQFSDDTKTGPKGGDTGPITAADLDKSAPEFKAAVLALHVGEVTPSPPHDRAGYEILRLDSSQGNTYYLHRILVAAPNPYTVRSRPAWWKASIQKAVSDACSGGQVVVFLTVSKPPCSVVLPSPGGSPVSSGAPAPKPS